MSDRGMQSNADCNPRDRGCGRPASPSGLSGANAKVLTGIASGETRRSW
jgi:hypothetical protein